ncbi:MAG: DUF4430 domain-containing protein [Gaiellaceae bacterium]
MNRRLIAAVVAALVIVPSAAAARVHVRVEGVTQTIFGATAPTLDVKLNALDALESASVAGEFYYHQQTTAYGPYVDQIGRYPASGNSGWVFKVNGVSPPVGADAVTLKDGDTVLWYWATFDSNGTGPLTLDLKRTKANCYAAFAQDDKGAETPAVGAALHVGSKQTVATKAGTACVGKHTGLLVRATLTGAVRSNALA